MALDLIKKWYLQDIYTGNVHKKLISQSDFIRFEFKKCMYVLKSKNSPTLIR